MEPLENPVFSNEVVEFVKCASAYCDFAENFSEIARSQVVETALVMLNELYYRIGKLPRFDNTLNEDLEHAVNESDWDRIEQKFLVMLGSHNEYLEVFDPRMHESDGPVVCSIAEDMADIYQDLKNLIALFHIGTVEVMNDALWEAQGNFKRFWGQKIVNVSRALHNLRFNIDGLDEPDEAEIEPADPDTSGWFITRRQQEAGEEE